MSVKVMAQVWELPSKEVSGPCRLLLLAIADHADPAGVAWPSRKRLADMCGMSVRSVIRHLQEAEQKELLRIESRTTARGAQASNRYVLTLPPASGDEPGPEAAQGDTAPVATCHPPVAEHDRGVSATPTGGVTDCHGGGDTAGTGGGTDCPPGGDTALSPPDVNHHLNLRQEPTREPPPARAHARSKPPADLPDYVPEVVVAVFSRQSSKARKAFQRRLAEAPDERTAADALAELAQSLENGAELTNLAAYFARILERHAGAGRTGDGSLLPVYEKLIAQGQAKQARAERRRQKAEAQEPEEAKRDAEYRRWQAEVERAEQQDQEKRARLDATFRALPPDEQQALVHRALAEMPPILAGAVSPRAPLVGALGRHVRDILERQGQDDTDAAQSAPEPALQT
jgi:hypothetical protein